MKPLVNVASKSIAKQGGALKRASYRIVDEEVSVHTMRIQASVSAMEAALTDQLIGDSERKTKVASEAKKATSSVAALRTISTQFDVDYGTPLTTAMLETIAAAKAMLVDNTSDAKKDKFQSCKRNLFGAVKAVFLATRGAARKLSAAAEAAASSIVSANAAAAAAAAASSSTTSATAGTTSSTNNPTASSSLGPQSFASVMTVPMAQSVKQKAVIAGVSGGGAKATATTTTTTTSGEDKKNDSSGHNNDDSSLKSVPPSKALKKKPKKEGGDKKQQGSLKRFFGRKAKTEENVLSSDISHSNGNNNNNNSIVQPKKSSSFDGNSGTTTTTSTADESMNGVDSVAKSPTSPRAPADPGDSAQRQATIRRGAPSLAPPSSLALSALAAGELRGDVPNERATREIIDILLHDLPGFTSLWTELPAAKRTSILKQCVDVLDDILHEMHNDEELSQLAAASSSTEDADAAVLSRAAQVKGDRLARLKQNRERSGSFIRSKSTKNLLPKAGLASAAAAAIAGDDATRNRLRLRLEAAKTPIAKFELVADELEDLCLALLSRVADAMREGYTKQASLKDTVEEVYNALAEVASACVEHISHTPGPRMTEAMLQVYKSVLEGNLEAVQGSPMHGQIGDAVTAAASSHPKEARKIVLSVLHSTESLQARMQRLFAQLIDEVRIASDTKRQDLTFARGLILQVGSTCEALAESVGELLSRLETYLYVASSVSSSAAASATENPSSSSPSSSMVVASVDVGNNIWDEPPLPAKYDKRKEIFRPGTLNHLVLRLTDTQDMDMMFMRTFVLTYQSFTNPWTLIEKLIERYHVPVDQPGVTIEDAKTIKLRVCVVLKYWFENQFFDFDDVIVNRITQFVSEVLPRDGQTAMANALMQVIERGKASQKPSAIYSPPRRLFVPQVDRSPTSLLLHFSARDVAEQLTMIDAELFLSVRPHELIGQAWNSKKLKYRAQNVLEMISRANKMSFWTASMILWLPTKQERSRMMMKLIDVCGCLRDIHNYNTLMSLVAGIGMSPVHRLKHSWAMLTKESKALKDEIHKLVSPSGSYKRLRHAWSESSSCIPYLGTFLTDLTFIGDGNPDHVELKYEEDGESRVLKAINMKKRQMEAEALTKLQQFQQQSAFQFPRQEPLHTFVSDLPSSSEADLYSLSLQWEPRNAKEEDIA